MMNNNFTAEFFQGNRRRLLEAVDISGPVILTAHGQLQRSSDAAFAFQQDSSFWYLTGIEYPDTVVVIGGKQSYIIVPKREAVREAFDGAISLDALKKQTGFDAVYEETEGWDRLEKELKAAGSYATLAPNPPYFATFGIYANPARAVLAERIKSIKADVDVVDIRIDVARLRMIKQPQELRALQRAIDITIDALQEVAHPEKIPLYTYEYQLEADIARGFRFRGSRGHAFDPIVAGGKNATTIHNVSNDAPLRPEDLVVIDIGAEYQHYCADITRTLSLDGRPSKRQAAVHEAVLDVQEYACGLVKPGMKLREYEKEIERYMGEKLLQLKLIKSADKEAIRKYYPHACSHFLGLDPHDAGDYDQELEPGTVITVEPGIYIPEEGIGVRIEDDVLLTDSGMTVLSSRMPKTLS